MGTAAIAGGGGTTGAGGTARVAVSDRSVAIKVGAGFGAGAFTTTGSVRSIADFGSDLTVAAAAGTADGSTHVGVGARGTVTVSVTETGTDTGTGTSVTCRSTASKRFSRHGKSKPGSPSSSLPKLRLNSNACISKESSTAVCMGLRSRKRSGMRGIFHHIKALTLGHFAQVGGANDPRQFFRPLAQDKTLYTSILKAKNGSGTEPADGIGVSFAPGVCSHQCDSLERA